MTTRHIYKDNETSEAEEQILKIVPDFKFTEIYKNAIMDFRNKIIDEPCFLENEIKKIEFHKKVLEDKQIEYQQMIKEIKKRKEIKKVDNEGLDKLKKEKIEQAIKNISYFYKLTDKKLLNSLSKEFCEQELDFGVFMKEKGYEMKSI